MLAYNEVIVDSCEGYSIRAVYKGSPLASDLVSYNLHNDSTDSVMESYLPTRLSYAEQRLDDLANSAYYKNLHDMPLLKKTAKVLTV